MFQQNSFDGSTKLFSDVSSKIFPQQNRSFRHSLKAFLVCFRQCIVLTFC